MQGSVELTESLGVSIGTTNLVAARPGQAPVTRRSVLTLWDDRPAEVGAPGAGGTVLRGFVERVGDPVPLVAADGSAHRGEALTAEAVEALARVVGGDPPPRWWWRCPRIGDPVRSAHSAARCAMRVRCRQEAFPPCWYPMPPPHSQPSPSTPDFPIVE